MKDNLRILFPFAGDTVGGSHISAWHLIQGLKILGVDPIISLHQDGLHLRWIQAKDTNAELLKLPHATENGGPLTNYRKILNGLWKARKFIRQKKIDLVHCNDSRMNKTWAIWAKACGVPMVWHQRSKWSSNPGIQTKFAVSLASGVISISQYSMESLPANSAPHEIIYNPVIIEHKDKLLCGRMLKSEFGIPIDYRIIGSFGNIRSIKRPDTFIEAAGILRSMGIDKVMFLWFGNDYDDIFEELLKSSNLNIIVKRIPFRLEVVNAMAGCDIILATSERDAFGRTLVEAMSVGVPVVASAAGGHMEIIENNKNGLLFPVGNASACASAISSLLKNQGQYKGLVYCGRETAKRFDPILHAKQVLQFYKRILKS